MEKVLNAALDAIANGKGAALVSPVGTSGSLPTGRHARMLVCADGTCVGTVGGGQMEAAAQAAAEDAIVAQRARILEISLTAEDALADGLLCGGEVTFLIEPLCAHNRDAFAEMLHLSQLRQPGMEAVRFAGSHVTRMVVGPGGQSVGSLGYAALDAVAKAQVGRVIADDLQETADLNVNGVPIAVYVHALRVRPVLYLFGAGHVGQAVGKIASLADFKLVVIDDRPEFANRARFPMADAVYVRPFEQAFEGLPIDAESYLAIMTRGHLWDRVVLGQALRTRAAYIGMIGSRRKIQATFNALESEGFHAVDFERVHAPIGLNIGGDSPGEIAISVVAELVQVRYDQLKPRFPAASDGESVPWDVLLSGCR